MIILGDIASPNKQSSKCIADFFSENNEILKDESILFNLEGLLSDNQNLNDNSPILFNNSSILDLFNSYTNRIASLANNHTLDLPHLLVNTKDLLASKGFKSIGAGKESEYNFQLVEIVENNMQVFVINACWDFLMYHQDNRNPDNKVNILDESKILNQVRKLKANYPDSKIVTYFHWSFDLETLPSPSYRLFAKDLIDQGVSLVVGCHSHCVQGGEKYKDGYIIYGLGNFYIPSGVYANGNLKFPSMSDLGWMVEWNLSTNRLTNYWINTSDNKLVLNATDEFEGSDIRKKYSPFEGMSDREYVSYFRKNRRKKLLIPVFETYKPSIVNALKMNFLKTRAKSARMLAKYKLIKWQN